MDLGLKKDFISAMDWMNTVVESIKINLYSFIFKHRIDIANTEEKDLTELIQQAAYVSVITILKEWS